MEHVELDEGELERFKSFSFVLRGPYRDFLAIRDTLRRDYPRSRLIWDRADDREMFVVFQDEWVRLKDLERRESLKRMKEVNRQIGESRQGEK